MPELRFREPIPNAAYRLPEAPTRDLAHLPGPRANPLTGYTARFVRRDHETIEALAGEHGNLFTLPFLLGRRAVVLLGAEANRRVLGNAEKIFSSHHGYSALGIFGRAVVTRDFEDHSELRRLVAGSFSKTAVDGYLRVVDERVEDSVGRLQAGRSEIYPHAKSLALGIAAQVFAGVEFGRDGERMNRALQAIIEMPGARVPLRIPGGAIDRGRRGLVYARRFFLDRVPERRVGTQDDLFSRLCRAENERGECLSDEEIADNAVGAVIAGHDTSTIAMACLAYELARHGAWQERLRAELQVGASSLLERCVKEVLRLYTPIRYLQRRSVEPFEFEGHSVPRNAAVIVSLHHTHRNPKFFDRPDEFRPERFEEPAFDPYAWAPFGKGAHLCLGMSFATREIEAWVRALLDRYRLEPVAGAQLEIGGLPVSKPRSGVPVELSPR